MDDYARFRGASLSSSGAASVDEAVDAWRSASKRERRRSICCCDFSVMRRWAAISSMALLRAAEMSLDDEAETELGSDADSMDPSPVNNHDLDKPN